jgi:hypothetical protein
MANDEGWASMSASDCPENSAESATSDDELLFISVFCHEHLPAFRAALKRRSELPFPQPRLLRLAQWVPDAPIEQAIFELDALFLMGDVHPSPLAFDRLRQLIDGLNMTYWITSVRISGHVDAQEASWPGADDLADLRAESIRRYLVSAGVKPAVIETGRGGPVLEDKADRRTRVRDRRARIVVTALRNEPQAGPEPASAPPAP